MSGLGFVNQAFGKNYIKTIVFCDLIAVILRNKRSAENDNTFQQVQANCKGFFRYFLFVCFVIRALYSTGFKPERGMEKRSLNVTSVGYKLTFCQADP